MSKNVGIEACDAEIEAWARSVAGDSISVSLVDPATLAVNRAAPEPVVEIALIDVQPSPGADLPGKPTLRITLRYLVTVRADDVHKAHGVLSKLIFAAMMREGQDVERNIDWLSFWHALCIAPRPSFLIVAHAQVIRPALRRAPVPAEGLRVIDIVLPSPGSTFHGVVMRRSGGSGQAPAMGVGVLCADGGEQNVRDAEGQFDDGVLPPWPARKRIEVHSGDLVWQFEVDVSHAHNAAQAKPLMLEIEVS